MRSEATNLLAKLKMEFEGWAKRELRSSWNGWGEHEVFDEFISATTKTTTRHLFGLKPRRGFRPTSWGFGGFAPKKFRRNYAPKGHHSTRKHCRGTRQCWRGERPINVKNKKKTTTQHNPFRGCVVGGLGAKPPTLLFCSTFLKVDIKKFKK